jgi:hypothetical protein
MSQPVDRFGIGSLPFYNEPIEQVIGRPIGLTPAESLGASLRGTAKAQRSIQEPVVAPPAPQPDRLTQIYEQKVPLYERIMGTDQASRLKEQKDLTQAQMLFDIANTALAFSTAGSRPGMSPAERLAEASQQTQLFPTISARAQKQLESKQAVEGETKKAQLAALQSAEAQFTAEAKAQEDIKLQKLKGSQDFAKIKLEDRLGSASNQALEKLKQTGRIELQDVKSIDDLGLEDRRQVNRVALENVQQTNRTSIERLRQDGSEASLVLADQLEKENIQIKADLELNRMGVANGYDIEQIELKHEQAQELLNSEQTLKREMQSLELERKDRGLQLEELRTLANASQGEEKLRLERQAQELEIQNQAFDQAYKIRKLEIDAAAARLGRLGGSIEARITTLISDPATIKAYADGTLGPEETLELNQSIAYYNNPKQVWDEQNKVYKLSPGNPLSNELIGAIRKRRDGDLSVPNVKVDDLLTPSDPGSIASQRQKRRNEMTSSITKGLKDPAAAFGSDALAKNLVNNLVEGISFGAIGAPFTPEKDAITAATALNTRYIQLLQDAAELRDSVAQLELLKKLTANPASFFVGDDAAASKIRQLIAIADDSINLLEISSQDYPADSKRYSEVQEKIDKLYQIRQGYQVFQKAYDIKNAPKAGAGGFQRLFKEEE